MFRIVPDLQHFQAVAAAEGAISQVLHTLRQGHLFQMHPFAKCAAAHRDNLRRKVKLLCCAEIKCFLPDMCKPGGEMNLRQRFTAAECSVTNPGHAVRQTDLLQFHTLRKCIFPDSGKSASSRKPHLLKLPVLQKCPRLQCLHISRDLHQPKSGTLCKASCADPCQMLRQMHLLQCIAIPKCILSQLQHGIRQPQPLDLTISFKCFLSDLPISPRKTKILLRSIPLRYPAGQKHTIVLPPVNHHDLRILLFVLHLYTPL